MATCMGPAQDQTRQDPHAGSGKWTQLLHLTKKLSAADNSLAKKRFAFSAGVSLSIFITLDLIPCSPMHVQCKTNSIYKYKYINSKIKDTL